MDATPAEANPVRDDRHIVGDAARTIFQTLMLRSSRERHRGRLLVIINNGRGERGH